MVKNLKIGISLSLLSLVLAPSIALAQSASPSYGSVRANLESERIPAIKKVADREIDKRLASLNLALTRINSAVKLSTTDKSTFATEIQTDITNLTNLKTKIDADTDFATLKTDAKGIFTDFRIYAVFLPQVHELAAVDIMGITADNLTTLAGKLQTRITQAQSQGKDVSNLNSWLSDMSAKIADAKTQYSGVESEIASLTPSSYPGSTTTLQDARNKIKTGAADLKAAVADARQILQTLKSFNQK